MKSRGRKSNKDHHHRHHKDTEEPKYKDEYSNRSIFLNNIPLKSNNLPNLIAHYKRFGHIDAIYTSGTHASIIFESEEVAKAACESQLTVLHNRFINVSLQKPTVPNVANLSSVCNMDLVKNAIQDFKNDSEKEAQETEEIRASLKKKTEQRKIEKAKMIRDNYKKELNLMVQETQTIILEIEQLPDEEKEASRARLSSLYDMISTAQKKIDNIEKLIQEANSINDSVSNEEKST